MSRSISASSGRRTAANGQPVDPAVELLQVEQPELNLRVGVHCSPIRPSLPALPSRSAAVQPPRIGDEIRYGSGQAPHRSGQPLRQERRRRVQPGMLGRPVRRVDDRDARRRDAVESVVMARIGRDENVGAERRRRPGQLAARSPADRDAAAPAGRGSPVERTPQAVSGSAAATRSTNASRRIGSASSPTRPRPARRFARDQAAGASSMRSNAGSS